MRGGSSRHLRNIQRRAPFRVRPLAIPDANPSLAGTQALNRDHATPLAACALNRWRTLGRNVTPCLPVLDHLSGDRPADGLGNGRGAVFAQRSHGEREVGLFSGHVGAAGSLQTSLRFCTQSSLRASGAKSLAMKTLAQRVKEHRDSLGMTPSEYARHVGTSRQNINNLEAGKAGQPRYVAKLAKAMGTTVDALLGAPIAKPAPVDPSSVQSGTPAYLAELAAKMSPERQERLVAVAELLAGPQGDQIRFSFSLVEHDALPKPGRAHLR